MSPAILKSMSPFLLHGGFVGNGTIEGLLEAMTEFNMNYIHSLGELVVGSVLSFDRLERGEHAATDHHPHSCVSLHPTGRAW